MKSARDQILERLGNQGELSAVPFILQPSVAQLQDDEMWQRFEKRVGDSRAVLEQPVDRQQALQRARLILSDLPGSTGSWRWRLEDGELSELPIVGAPADLFEDGDALVTSANAAVAETGSLVFVSAEGQGASPLYLAETLIVLLDRTAVYPSQETLWQSLLPVVPKRAVNFVTGPSRTADIEQTMELGAHGPRSVYILAYTTA